MQRILFMVLTTLVLASTSFAEVTTAHPLGFPTAIGPVAEKITLTYNLIFWICLVIFAIVQVLILYAVFKFRRSKNPTPAKFSHNNMIEIIWTIIPVFICAVIAWASFDAMKLIRTMPEGGETVEAIAYQFGWEFDYPDYGISSPEAEAAHEQLSSAGVNRFVKDIVVPVDTNIKMHITGRDVIHAFYAPDLGIKIDAVPGRINYAWFKATKEGDYIGQCAELCGAAHGEMFFNVKVVSKDAYQAWVNARRIENGAEPINFDAPQVVASE